MREALSGALRFDYHVDAVGDAETALTKLSSEKFDLVIVDLGLPNMDGHKFCAKVKSQEKTSDIAVIIFSGNTDIENKLIGFSVGANDYMSKPADLRELKARIQIQLKKVKTARQQEQFLDVGPFHANLVNHSISIWTQGEKKELDTSPLEFRLLHFFLTHLDHVLSREQLLDHVWGNARNVNDRSVDAVVSKLRQKLGAHSVLLKSVHGAGYRFCRPTENSEIRRAS